MDEWSMSWGDPSPHLAEGTIKQTRNKKNFIIETLIIMSNYCFTVSAKQDKEGRKLHWTDYTRIWDDFGEAELIILYKVEHQADKECPHLHYHGLLQSNGTFSFKKVMRNDYTYKFEVCTNYQKWFNYCLHEIKSEREKVKQELQDRKEQQICNKVMHAIPYKKLKQNHITLKKNKDETFTIKLY